MGQQRDALSGALKEEFHKDLELFKYFLLLLNDSSPIRNVELMWVEELDLVKFNFTERVSTVDALVQLQSADLGLSNRSSPSTLFCDLVHGFGAHEEQTCARSDVQAKRRCQSTGCSQIYSCHVGLTDIAVPVICDGEYLGTLFSGQVSTKPLKQEEFEHVRNVLNGQTHIDFVKLEAAYYQVQLVTETQLSEMVRVLERFARYIANSWKRLQIMGASQRMRDRELALNRKELAAVLLSGDVGDRQELNALAADVGMRRLPNRVIVLRMNQTSEVTELHPQIANHITLSRLSHIVEDHCQSWNNTLAMVVRPGELCIFTGHDIRNSNHDRILIQEMADSILSILREQSVGSARIGISQIHSQPEELIRAYHEACAALDCGGSNICFFNAPKPQDSHSVQPLAPLIKAIQRGVKVNATVGEFLAQAMPSDSSGVQLQHSRAFLTWAMEHLALEMISVGTDASKVSVAKEHAIARVLEAPNPFSICEWFQRFSQTLADEVAWTFSQREHKIVLAVRRLVEEKGVTTVTIQELADALHISTGHLSRVYSRTTKMTLEEYLIRQRLELAKRMLLDPRHNVAEVAEQCGFCSPAYFASVFKKYAQTTPRAFASQPRVWTPLLPAVAPKKHKQRIDTAL